MGKILLADSSAHARRMGEIILREEGYQVVVVGDGAAALAQFAQADPDLLIADAFLPNVDGLSLCRQIKVRHGHARVMLTAGLLKPFDERKARAAGADATLWKPFEASVMAGKVRPLVQEAMEARRAASDVMPEADAENIRRQVAKAVEAELPRIVDEITRRVIRDLKG